MDGVIPDASDPWITLQIHGLAYRYTMKKDPNTDGVVWIRNEDAIDGGYVFEEKDDWSGSPGGTVRKYFRFPYIDSTRWGKGSIDVEGDGEVTNALLTYNYRMDVDDELMKCTLTPLADPACPGFEAALQNLLNQVEVSPDDPYYDEWVQAQLDREAEVEEEEQVNKEEENEEEELEVQLGQENTIEELASNQGDVMAALAQVPKIEPYYTVIIPGGVYEDVLVLEDKNLPDNRRALRNLASDETHRSMVRSQYDREQ